MVYKAMFSPIRIGNMTVKNRFVVPPMGNNFANTDGTLSGRSLAYYATRAKGGFGLITIEATVVDPTAKGGPRKPCLFDDTTVDSFRRVADACHAYGAKVSVQLQHAGPEGDPALTGFPLKAASPVEAAFGKAIPREITRQEIMTLVERYGDSAARARAAGVDCVELHCAHGYLLHSFLSPRTNHRTDAFGGCLENRLRFLRLILENIRKKAGADYPVLCRINGCDDVPGGLTVQDSAVIAMCLEEMGVSALHVSRAVHLRDDKLWATGLSHGGFSSDVVSQIKAAVSIPVIAVGRFTEAAQGEVLIRQGRADLIAFGRQSIADPELPNKVQAGREELVHPCIGCLQGCVPNMFRGEPITCLVNPAVGREGEAGKLTQEKKRVLVVGGGPAGLMAAKTCAKRGHTVTLYEAAEQPGGQMALAAVPPGKGAIAGMLSSYLAECEEVGVQLCWGRTVTPELIAELSPDVVILATGGVPLRPEIPGIDGENCVTAGAVLGGRVSCGKAVLIVGGGMVGCETAAFLGERHHAVTILESGDTLARDMGREHRQEVLDLCSRYGVKTMTGAVATRFCDDGAVYEKDGREAVLNGFDTIVLAMGAKRWDPLSEAVKAMGVEWYRIGDAASPRRALDGTREGYCIAEKL